MDDADEHDRRLAETVRAACLAAARNAYEDTGLSGLCAEGRFEAALSAMAALDLDGFVTTGRRTHGGPPIDRG